MKIALFIFSENVKHRYCKKANGHAAYGSEEESKITHNSATYR